MYPEMTVSTPSRCWNWASVHQKQPPAKIAVSICFEVSRSSIDSGLEDGTSAVRDLVCWQETHNNTIAVIAHIFNIPCIICLISILFCLQYNLSELGRGIHFPQRFFRIFKRTDAINDRPYLLRFNQCQHTGKVSRRSHCRPEQGKLLPENLSAVERRNITGGSAEEHDPASWVCQIKIMCKTVTQCAVQNHVKPANLILKLG